MWLFSTNEEGRQAASLTPMFKKKVPSLHLDITLSRGIWTGTAPFQFPSPVWPALYDRLARQPESHEGAGLVNGPERPFGVKMPYSGKPGRL